MKRRRNKPPTRFRCGHRRTRLNTVNPKTHPQCRTCRNAQRRRAWWAERNSPAPAPVVLPISPDTPDAIALYRAEKAKRSAHSNPVMESAKVAYAQLLRDSAPQRTGRPKGSKNNGWADLSDLLSEQSA